MTKLYIKRNMNELAELAFRDKYTCDLVLVSNFYNKLHGFASCNIEDLKQELDEKRRIFVGNYTRDEVEVVFASFAMRDIEAECYLLAHMGFIDD